MTELKNNGVSIYQFPTEDETVADINREMNNMLPFAVVGSNEFVKVGYCIQRILGTHVQHPFSLALTGDGLYDASDPLFHN